MEMVNTTYKFYLSLENALCKDYITEKFWKVLPYNVIPIVLNGVDMSTLAPYHSYIDIKDFPSFEGGWRDDMITFPFKTIQGQMPIARSRNAIVGILTLVWNFPHFFFSSILNISLNKKMLLYTIESFEIFCIISSS